MCLSKVKRLCATALSAAFLLCTVMPISVQAAAKTVTENDTGTIDGYNYELWKDNGTTSMTLNGGGTFSCEWSNINNSLFRTGKKFDETKTHEQLGKISLDYACNYNPSGNSYLAVYGWTSSPLVEYYIVDSWGSWRPPGATSKGTITVDGGTYDVYETTRTDQPSIKGTATFQQYWSVRTSKRTSGTISVSDHFKAWEKMGMKLGKMYEVSLVVEGYQSSGKADVTKMSLNVDGATDTLKGDVNGDGKVDVFDATLVKAVVLKKKDKSSLKKPENADMDGKDGITALDYLLIKKKAQTGPDDPPKPTTAKFHCFLLLGQSNMAGYPKAQDSDKVKDPRIQSLGYYNDKWDVACPPLHESYQGAIGPGDWFAKTLIQKVPTGDTIGLIPCAISGEKIETFMKSGGSKYNWIVNRAKLAQEKGGVIEGIIFHQGESNSGDPSWPGKVNTLVEDLRKDLNLGNVPFIAGELLYSGGCASHNKLVNQLPSVVKNCSVVSASGLTQDPTDTQWRLHFSHDSQVTLGKRYAEKMIQALGW